MKLNLIVPMAADKPEYEQIYPLIFNFTENGSLFCIKAILGLNLERFDHIYFTILKKHDKKYSLRKLLNIQIKRFGLRQAEVVVLNKSTKSQAESVYMTIIEKQLKGAIFIKDADSYFECDFTAKNGIAIYPLDKLNIVDPQNKSYVAIDDKFYITNIIEKKL